jgi:hypothetical protein
MKVVGFSSGFSDGFLGGLVPGVLRYDTTLNIDYMSIVDWTCVADGTLVDIGVLLKVGRGDILIAYTPDVYTSPDSTYTQNRYTSGNIFITTEHQTIWIKSVGGSDWPVTLSGELPEPPDPLWLGVPAITQGLPWRLG